LFLQLFLACSYSYVPIGPRAVDEISTDCEVRLWQQSFLFVMTQLTQDEIRSVRAIRSTVIVQVVEIFERDILAVPAVKQAAVDTTRLLNVVTRWRLCRCWSEVADYFTVIIALLHLLMIRSTAYRPTQQLISCFEQAPRGQRHRTALPVLACLFISSYLFYFA